MDIKGFITLAPGVNITKNSGVNIHVFFKARRFHKNGENVCYIEIGVVCKYRESKFCQIFCCRAKTSKKFRNLFTRFYKPGQLTTIKNCFQIYNGPIYKELTTFTPNILY
jgi:hypothetical protein